MATITLDQENLSTYQLSKMYGGSRNDHVVIVKTDNQGLGRDKATRVDFKLSERPGNIVAQNSDSLRSAVGKVLAT